MLHPYLYRFVCIKVVLICACSVFGNNSQRRYSTSFTSFDQNQTVDVILNESFNNGQFDSSLEGNLTNFYSALNPDQLLSAFDYTLHALLILKDFNINTANSLSDIEFYNAVDDVLSSFIDSSLASNALTRDFQDDLTGILIENFITDPIGVRLFPNIKDNMSKVSSLYFQSVVEQNDFDLVEDAISSLLYSTISIYDNQNPNNIDFNSTNFTPNIIQVARDDQNETESMLYGGVEGFYNFNPLKSNLVAATSESISEIFFDSYFTNTTEADSNSTQLFNLLSTGFYTGLSKASDDFGREGNEAFVFELLKQTSSQITSGSTIHLFTNSSFMESGLSFTLTEELTYALSKVAIETLATGNNDVLDYNKISESIAFGSSMGAQNEKVLTIIGDFSSNLANTRKLLSQSLAYGSSQGSLVALSNLSLVDQNIGWDQIKEVASHAAKGTMIANVANAIYFGEEKDLLPVINFSAQGATFGATSTLELNNIEKPQGKIEDLSVEVARSSSHGASLGATFAVVGLKSADPLSNENDSLTKKTVNAVTYGSTIGSILGASESGNGDPVVVQQASKQGVTEGSLIGSGFAVGFEEDFFVNNNYDEINLGSKKSIISTVNDMNEEASMEAMNSLATKKVKTSSRDMLLLIRKFNIRPNTTNPATIYQRPSGNKSENDFPFPDKFPAATPI
jgi:hypothetical protein